MLKHFLSFFKKYSIHVLIVLISIPYLAVQVHHGGDFRILLRGAEYLMKGISPYGILMQIDATVTDVFLYSPFVGFLMMPLTLLPEFIPTYIFCLLNIFVLFRLWKIMSDWLEIEKLSRVRRRWWYGLTIALILRFILHNFENTQQNILVLYLSLEGLYQVFMRGRNRGGILLALGICIKLLPLVFLPYLVYRKRISALMTAIFCTVFLLFLPAMWFGCNFELELLKGWCTAINPSLDKYNSDQNVGIMFHCITALIPVYFSDCSYHGFSVNIMNLDKHRLFMIINVTRVSLVLFVYYFLRTGAAAKGRSPIFLFWEMTYIFLLIPLIFPNQNKYAYTNLLPAFAYIAYYLVSTFALTSPERKRDKIILLSAMSVVVILSVLTADIFWGMATGKYFQFMKLITVGTLVLIPVLAYFSPSRLNAENKSN